MEPLRRQLLQPYRAVGIHIAACLVHAARGVTAPENDALPSGEEVTPSRSGEPVDKKRSSRQR